MYPDVIRLKLEIDTLEHVRAKAAADTAAAPPMPVSPSVLRVKAMRGQLDAEIKALQAEEQSIRRDPLTGSASRTLPSASRSSGSCPATTRRQRTFIRRC